MSPVGKRVKGLQRGSWKELEGLARDLGEPLTALGGPKSQQASSLELTPAGRASETAGRGARLLEGVRVLGSIH